MPLGWLPDAVPASLDPANQKRIGDILQLAEKMNIQVLGMDIVRGQLVVQRYGGHRRVNYEFNHPLTSLHPRVTDETRALILHTSGTTSRPKCVPLSHGNLMKTVRNIIYTYQLTDKDRSLIVMPLFHVHGLLASLLATLGSSGSVVITSGKFSKSSCWRDLAKYECTWYSAVPTIHHLLSDGFCPLPKLRFIRSCSAPLAPSLFQLMEKKTGVPVLEAYAMTEVCHFPLIMIASNSKHLLGLTSNVLESITAVASPCRDSRHSTWNICCPLYGSDWRAPSTSYGRRSNHTRKQCHVGLCYSKWTPGPESRCFRS